MEFARFSAANSAKPLIRVCFGVEKVQQHRRMRSFPFAWPFL